MPTLKTRDLALPFDNPGELAVHIYPEYQSQQFQYYDWAKKVTAHFSLEFTDGYQNDINLVAANGSGKSHSIVAPCAGWHLACLKDSNTVLTSGSGVQLDRQTGRYLKRLCRNINKTFDKNYITIQARMLHSPITGGYVDMFATDEAERAEGWHALSFGSPFAIIFDEGKNIHDDIYIAASRCHDAQRFLKVSSAGDDSGGFYRSCQVNEKNTYTVQAYDCHHISQNQIEKTIETYGLNSPIVRSIIFSEFTSEDDSVIIKKTELDALFETPALPCDNREVRIGVDLAGGGDENVITRFKGNKQTDLIPFKEKDTTETVARLDQILMSLQVSKDNNHINADDGGLGKPIIDHLRKKGWKINRILNQSRPFNTELFTNRGAELYFNFASFVTEQEIILLDDDILRKQLCKRYFKRTDRRFGLENKQTAKIKGHPSPDRADATILALAGLKAPYFAKLKGEKPTEITGDLIKKLEAQILGRILSGELIIDESVSKHLIGASINAGAFITEKVRRGRQESDSSPFDLKSILR